MQTMVDAAVALFAEEGYDGVSTRAVAERAGCSETLLFRYFGGKRGLLLGICNALVEAHYERVRAEDFNDLGDYLQAQMLTTLGRIREDASAVRIITAAIVTDSELAAEFERRHDDAVADLTEQLAHFQRSGAIAPEVDIAAIATAFEQMGFALGLLVQVVYGKSQEELTTIVGALTRALSIGMSGEAGAGGGEAFRREAVQAALRANADIERLLALLGGGGPVS